MPEVCACGNTIQSNFEDWMLKIPNLNLEPPKKCQRCRLKEIEELGPSVPTLSMKPGTFVKSYDGTIRCRIIG